MPDSALTERERIIRIALDGCANMRRRMYDHGFHGEWMHEPDRLTFQQAGLDCLIQRNEATFTLNGYASVGPHHPFYDKKELVMERVSCHGGVTWAGRCSGILSREPLLVDEGIDEELYWIGFDCAHAWDLAPGIEFGMTRILPRPPGIDAVYRTFDYVKAEVEALAEFLTSAEVVGTEEDD